METKLKHLELVQGIINRMAHCSFLLKGWSVVLVSGLFALAAKDANVLFVYLAYLPVIAFWILDGYYLYQERLYRQLYGEIRKTDPNNIDFGMNANKFIGVNGATWPESILSKTMLLFHGILLVTIIVVMIVCLIEKVKIFPDSLTLPRA
ncbi:MAG: hypothetical protein V6Z89_18145 [Desulfobacter sp.]